MNQQNFKNHSKLVPLFHGVTGLMLLIGVSGAIVNFIKALGNGSGLLEAGLLLLVFIVAFFLLAVSACSAFVRYGVCAQAVIVDMAAAEGAIV